MLKSKRGKLGVILTCILSLSLMGAALAACSSHDGEVKVTFYDGDKVITEKWVEKDGTLEEFTPADVGYEKGEGFTFFDWFSTKNYTFEMDWEEAITKDKNVYSAWYSDEEDTRTWTIAGESPSGGPLLEIGWNGGIIDEGEVQNVLAKAEGKNEFKITINLYAGDSFQFCVQDEDGVWATNSDGSSVARGGRFMEDDEYFSIAKDALSGGQQNITVDQSGNYTFTLLTDAVDQNISDITYVRNGDAPEVVLDRSDFTWYIYGSSTKQNDDSIVGNMNWGNGYTDEGLATNMSTYAMKKISNNKPDGTGTWVLTGDFAVGDEFLFSVLRVNGKALATEAGTLFKYDAITEFNGLEANFEEKGDGKNIAVKVAGTYTFTLTVTLDSETDLLKGAIEVEDNLDVVKNGDWKVLGNRLSLDQITGTGGTENGHLGITMTEEEYAKYDSDLNGNNFGAGTNVKRLTKDETASTDGKAVFKITLKMDVGDYFYFCIPITVWETGRYDPENPDKNYSYATAGYDSKVAPTKEDKDLCAGITNVWGSNYACKTAGTYTFTLTISADGECSVTAVANS